MLERQDVQRSNYDKQLWESIAINDVN